MGNTSVKTAWSPRFFRREGGWSACKNSRYELVCNSIKFGGGMISLILPKLILSVARDGIFIPNQVAGDWPAGSFFRKRRKDRKSTRLNSSHLVISYAVFCLKKKKIY